MSASEHPHAMTERKVSSERVSEERLGQIATDKDNFYRPEIKAMAQELLALRSSVKTVGVPIQPLETRPQGDDAMEPSEIDVHEGSWALVMGTNAKAAGWIDTHALFAHQLYRDQILPTAALEAPTPQEAPSEVTEDMDGEPYENTLSLAELRREVRREWDDKNELIRALKELPEVPNWRVLRLLSRAATFPEDWSIGKQLQAKHGIEAIAPRTESEKGAGLWSRLRSALTAALKVRSPMTLNSEGLLPCPFCGGENSYVQNAGWKANTFIRCPDCPSSFATCDGPRPHEDSVVAWNRRALPPVDGLEVVAHAYVVEGECEQIEWGSDVLLPDDPSLRSTKKSS